MRRLLAGRLAQSLLVVLCVTTLSFWIVRLAPGEPFSYDSSLVTPAIRAHRRAQYGYDRPVGEQFVRYVASVAHGQFGYAWSLREPVSQALLQAIPRTLLLVGTSLAASLLLGIAVGVFQARHPGGFLDRVISAVLVFFFSLPDFWLAIMMLLAFSYWIPILPAGGYVEPVLHDYMNGWSAALDVARHLVLPALTLTLLTAAGIARYQRAAMLEVLPLEFVRTARAKGASERRVVWRHALRTSLTPIITMLGLMFPLLLGGALFVERVFAWPGMGLLAADAIATRDYDLITATVIVGAAMVAIGNLCADLLHAALDPRVRA
jgi:peptide/nickel transport system permease protein